MGKRIFTDDGMIEVGLGQTAAAVRWDIEAMMRSLVTRGLTVREVELLMAQAVHVAADEIASDHDRHVRRQASRLSRET